MSGFNQAAVIAAIKSVLPPAERTVLHEPVFSGNEWIYLKECIDTGWNVIWPPIPVPRMLLRLSTERRRCTSA
jgi:hypothetical protein